MFAFILIVNESKKPENAGCFLATIATEVFQESDGWYRIESDKGVAGGWMAILNQDSIAEYYQGKKLEQITARIGKPSFYLIQSRDKEINFSNALILSIDEAIPTLIDNNNGFLEDLAFMKNLIRSGIDWRYYSD